MKQIYTINKYRAQILALNTFFNLINPTINRSRKIAPIGRFAVFCFIPAPAPPGALDLFKRATFQTIFLKKYQSIKNQLVMNQKKNKNKTVFWIVILFLLITLADNL